MIEHLTRKSRILIVGSGPAGISTALSLAHLEPRLAGQIVVLEKSKHPRHKLCGGGVTALAEQVLAELQVNADVPCVPIHAVEFWLDNKPFLFEGDNLMRIVRRNEFDYQLVQAARQAGIEICEEEAVTNILRQSDGILVQTTRNSFLTQILVGADGAKSLVRRKLLPERNGRVSRLMEVIIKAPPDCTAFVNNMAVFDFRYFSENLQGYLWDFPCLVDGEPHLNVGVFDSRVHRWPHADLKALLQQRLSNHGIDLGTVELQGHPERWFVPRGVYSAENVLLVGDAAGIEPWLGEGISVALAYGPVAATAIADALEKQDYGFRDYTARIRRDRLGKLLDRNRRIARFFYARPSRPLLQAFVRGLRLYFQCHKQTA